MTFIVKISSEEMMEALCSAVYTKDPKVAMERILGNVATGSAIRKPIKVCPSFDVEVIEVG